MNGDLAQLRPASSGGLAGWLKRTLVPATPRARVSASATVRLGGPLEVEWRVDPARGTTLVTVSLVGSEVARRRVSARSGISIITERSDFFVVEIDRRVPSRTGAEVSGRGTTDVPAGLVPSLAAKFNDISWAVIVEVLAGVGPGSRQEFPLTVLPVQR
jgi:hypothetical protein